jgi:hypothetical protein
VTSDAVVNKRWHDWYSSRLLNSLILAICSHLSRLWIRCAPVVRCVNRVQNLIPGWRSNWSLCWRSKVHVKVSCCILYDGYHRVQDSCGTTIDGGVIIQICFLVGNRCWSTLSVCLPTLVSWTLILKFEKVDYKLTPTQTDIRLVVHSSLVTSVFGENCESLITT